MKNDKNQTKALIIEKALLLFSTKGYTETSVEEIANECNLTKGALYFYFKNKEGIAKAVLDESLQVSKNLIFDVQNIKNPQKRIHTLIKRAFKFILDNEHYWRSLNNLVYQRELLPLTRETFVEYQTLLLKQLSSYFKDLNLKSPEFEAKMLITLFDGIQLHYYINKDKKFFNKAQKYILKKYTPEFLEFYKTMEI